ncbi:iron complex outermembrane recepter protein [Arachidicoccus rhizosphaerae]|uniref:Iron complex outermembrane recepter protein n=1 Tax=Arachidicoccus rhizosphaerae TaxID=551991 RepID=A0A1H3WUW0_9BACT|nr:TonB-dependent receptor [Arachidicoccus rhizosphaerae]SDZ90760.1 iron complex outermembrane recepter protein [Arachidicoccus rhizosphaerae]
MTLLSHAVKLKAQLTDSSETQQDTTGTFKLGEVTVSTSLTPPIFNSVNARQMEMFGRNDAAQALNLLPGITLSKVGQRNEAMLYVRGFDLRRVPLLIDGIPVYVPYDGYVDLARFTTFDLASIQISKDYTSVNYGPNAMGGAINLITRKPTKSLEINGATGWLSGGFRSNFNVGSNLGKFYIQAGISKYKRDYFPMSKDFKPTAYEEGGHRENSYSDDEKVSLKVAFTPNEGSEYALSYNYQHGNKGTPVYAGSDTLNSLLKKPRYWRWPKWDKQSIAFLSNTQIDSSQSIKTRLYYDKFINTLNSYDDDTYSSMEKGYAFSSLYNDYTLGAIIEYSKQFGQIDHLIGSLQYKQDVHREHDLGEPIAKMADATSTAALEYQLNLSKGLKLLTGLSFNNRSSLKAQHYNSDTKQLETYTSNHNNAINVQGALQYSIDKSNELSISIARKTRFATTKDRYSFSMGTALPNPDLKAEYAINYDLSYNGSYLNNTLKSNAALFYSKINNTILSVDNVSFDSTSGTSLRQLQNVGQSEYMGFELGIDYNPITAIATGINYTYIKLNNISSPNLFFTDVPRSKLFGFVQYSLKSILSLQINGEYDSKRFSTSYGTTAGAFTLFNASAKVHVWKYFSLEGGINNIFDKNYQLTEGFPEPGRNYFVNLRYNL